MSERDVRVKVSGGSSLGDILSLWVMVALLFATCEGPRRGMVRQAREIYDDARATWNAPDTPDQQNSAVGPATGDTK